MFVNIVRGRRGVADNVDVKRVECSKSEMFFFLMIQRPPRSTQGKSSAASDAYTRQD